MRTRSITALLYLAVLGAAPAQSALSPEEDVTDFIQQYDRAWNNKDASAVARLLAPDYVYFSSKGQVQSRQHMLDMLVSAKYILAGAARSEIKVYRTSCTAVVSSRWQGHGSYDGKEFRDDQRCSIVLVRDGQTWRAVSEHCTQIVAP